MCERRHSFGSASSLYVGGAKVIRDVIAQITGVRLGAVQRLNGFGVIMIEDAGVSDDQPCKRSGIVSGMSAGVSFDSRISGWSAVLDELLRHRTQARRGNERLPNAAHARRNRTATPSGGGVRCGFLRASRFANRFGRRLRASSFPG